MSIRFNLLPLLATIFILNWSYTEAVYNGRKADKTGCVVQVGIKIPSRYTIFQGPGIYIEKDVCNYQELGYKYDYKEARIGAVIVSCHIISMAKGPEDLVVTAHSTSRTDYTWAVQRRVKIMRAHPKWNGGHKYDMCVLMLDEPMHEVKTCEFERNHQWVNTDAGVCGWGSTKAGCQLYQPIEYAECLHCASDRVMNKDECIARYEMDCSKDVVSDTTFCMNSQSSGASVNDVSAPVFNVETNRVIGIVTHAPVAGCKQGNLPTVVTSAVEIQKFIDDPNTWYLGNDKSYVAWKW